MSSKCTVLSAASHLEDTEVAGNWYSGATTHADWYYGVCSSLAVRMHVCTHTDTHTHIHMCVWTCGPCLVALVWEVVEPLRCDLTSRSRPLKAGLLGYSWPWPHFCFLVLENITSIVHMMAPPLRTETFQLSRLPGHDRLFPESWVRTRASSLKQVSVK